jgi:Na+:H+ antiporter, NhaA family
VELTRALREFLVTERVGGFALMLSAAVALVWANSGWGDAYRRLWNIGLAVNIGHWSLGLDLRHWVNDGLMAIFFLVVGLEIKRELVQGELHDPRRAAVPVVAAIGGMTVPAAAYLAINHGLPTSHGWGIPMATDIAFALGVASLFGRRIPPSLRLFLLTLAIVDDLGAILLIGAVYSKSITWGWLAVAAGLVVTVYFVRRAGVVFPPVYVVLGIALWLVVHESGLHGTLAGVAMGLLAPARPTLDREIVTSHNQELLDVFTPAAARTTTQLARLAVSDVEWLEHLLHPWTSLLIVPLFALANAGVRLSASSIAAATAPAAWGILAGLVIGKPAGICLSVWVATRMGVGLPQGTNWRQLAGMSMLAGIGFTVSLFIADIAFADPAVVEQAKIAILASSLLATALGAAALTLRRRPAGERT